MACHLQIDADPDPPHHLVAYPGPSYHVDADPDPTFQFDADPDPQTEFKFNYYKRDGSENGSMSVSHFNVSLLVTEADVQADAPLLQLAGNCARARPLPVRTQGLYFCY